MKFCSTASSLACFQTGRAVLKPDDVAIVRRGIIVLVPINGTRRDGSPILPASRLGVAVGERDHATAVVIRRGIVEDPHLISRAHVHSEKRPADTVGMHVNKE